VLPARRPVNRKAFAPERPFMLKLPRSRMIRMQRGAVRLRVVGATQRAGLPLPVLRPGSCCSMVNRTVAAWLSVYRTTAPRLLWALKGCVLGPLEAALNPLGEIESLEITGGAKKLALTAASAVSATVQVMDLVVHALLQPANLDREADVAVKVTR
jgi:hypothetical protein